MYMYIQCREGSLTPPPPLSPHLCVRKTVWFLAAATDTHLSPLRASTTRGDWGRNEGEVERDRKGTGRGEEGDRLLYDVAFIRPALGLLHSLTVLSTVAHLDADSEYVQLYCTPNRSLHPLREEQSSPRQRPRCRDPASLPGRAHTSAQPHTRSAAQSGTSQEPPTHTHTHTHNHRMTQCCTALSSPEFTLQLSWLR